MFVPKRVKYSKTQKGNKGKIEGITYVGSSLDKGFCGLQALEGGRITSNQLEAVRLVIVRKLKKTGKYFLRIFPDKPITKKAAETRMGGGKGAPDHFVSIVYTGRILFELADISEELAIEAFRLAADKLPIKTRVIWRII